LLERDSLWVSSFELQSRACKSKFLLLASRFVLDPKSFKNEFLRGFGGLSLSWSLQEEILLWVCFSRVGFLNLIPWLHRTLSSPGKPAPVVDSHLDPHLNPGLAAFHISTPALDAVVHDGT
jgi:hypothetical protein